METLQAQLDEVNAQIAEEQAKGAQRDQDVLAGLEQKQAVILMKMDDAKLQEEQQAAQMVRIQAQEVKVESEPIPIAVAGVDLSKLDPDLIQLMELVTKADRRARLVEFNAEVETIQNDHKEQLRQASEREQKLHDEIHKRSEDSLLDATKIDELEKEVKDMREMYEASQKQVHTLEFHVSHSDQTRDNAATELSGLQEAYKALQEEIQHMRVANVFGEKKAQKIIDITPEETNKAQNLVDSLVKKFVSTTPIGGNWHEVVDEAGNKMVVHANELQKLEEVKPFRPSAEVDQGNVESSAPTAQVTDPLVEEVTAPDLQFQGEVHPVPVAVVERVSNTNGTVSREEFEALKSTVMELCEVCNIGEVA